MKEDLATSYIIDFKDLDFGEHRVNFKVDDSLFAQYEGCDVMGGDCDVAIELRRSESMLTLEVDIQGVVTVECDRCLEPCDVEVDYFAPLVVKFSDNEELIAESDGEVVWLPAASTELDLRHYIYESIILSLPYQRVHAEGECNPEMIEKFKIITGEEFDQIEARSKEGDSEAMPTAELEKLAALKAMMESEK